MKRALLIFTAIFCIFWGSHYKPIYATSQTTTTAVETEDAPSRATRVLAFLGVFTICFAGGIYIGVRPTLRRLKAAKEEKDEKSIGEKDKESPKE